MTGLVAPAGGGRFLSREERRQEVRSRPRRPRAPPPVHALDLRWPDTGCQWSSPASFLTAPPAGDGEGSTAARSLGSRAWWSALTQAPRVGIGIGIVA